MAPALAPFNEWRRLGYHRVLKGKEWYWGQRDMRAEPRPKKRPTMFALLHAIAERRMDNIQLLVGRCTGQRLYKDADDDVQYAAIDLLEAQIALDGDEDGPFGRLYRALGDWLFIPPRILDPERRVPGVDLGGRSAAIFELAPSFDAAIQAHAPLGFGEWLKDEPRYRTQNAVEAGLALPPSDYVHVNIGDMLTYGLYDLELIRVVMERAIADRPHPRSIYLNWYMGRYFACVPRRITQSETASETFAGLMANILTTDLLTIASAALLARTDRGGELLSRLRSGYSGPIATAESWGPSTLVYITADRLETLKRMGRLPSPIPRHMIEAMLSAASVDAFKAFLPFISEMPFTCGDAIQAFSDVYPYANQHANGERTWLRKMVRMLKRDPCYEPYKNFFLLVEAHSLSVKDVVVGVLHSNPYFLSDERSMNILKEAYDRHRADQSNTATLL